MVQSDDFHTLMEKIGRLVEELDRDDDAPASRLAAELVRSLTQLHRQGLERMLAVIRAAGEPSLPLLEQFMQDDTIRTLLLYHDLHPIELRKRLTEAIVGLQPLVASYGGRIALTRLEPGGVSIRLELPGTALPGPFDMLKKMLEQSLLVAAPDSPPLTIEAGPLPGPSGWQLPILHQQSQGAD